MKKLFLISVSVLLSAVLYASEPFATYSFPSASITELEANTIVGNITLTGNADENTIVEVFVSGNNQRMDDSSIKEMLDEYYTIEVRVANGKLYAVIKHKNERRQPRRGLNISFIISVPSHVSGTMNSASGSIRISDTSGNLRFNTGSGSLTIDRISGRISGNTGSGGIHLANSNSTENVSLNTGSGSIQANNSTGNVSLNTGSGSVRANDLGGNISLNSGSGSVQASNCTGNVSLNTGSGSVRASSIEGEISLNSGSGNVTADNINGTLKAGSGSGNIVLKDISGNLSIVDNSRGNNNRRSGNIEVSMKLVAEYVIISNNSRNVDLTLPADKGYNLNVTAENVNTSGMRGFRGEMDRSTLNGTLGTGAAKIEINKTQRVNLSFE